MPVLFFDGECVLCNNAAHWIAERNPSGNIRFASLQGAYAKEKLGERFQGAETMVLMDEGRFFARSAAVFTVLKYLPAWRWLRALRFIPRPIADGLYNLVAKNRFRWFGRYTECPVPASGLRDRFITS